jgi:predicted DNA-binding protein YlxM (UPF0122 family)
MTNNNWKNLQVNKNVTIEDYCSRLYTNFENVKQQFLKCFDSETDTINFDKFIPMIKKDLNHITYYVCTNVFYNNEENWDLSDTYDWLRICFDKFKSSTNIKQGRIIQLYYTNNFQQSFCAECKTILANIIKNKLQYLNRQKRKCDFEIISIEGDYDKMKDLQDLKDYLDDIITWQAYAKFKRVLGKTESLIFDIALFAFYKQKVNITQEEIAKELEVNKSTISKNIKGIQKKWEQYKIDNNLN